VISFRNILKRDVGNCVAVGAAEGKVDDGEDENQEDGRSGEVGEALFEGLGEVRFAGLLGLS